MPLAFTFPVGDWQFWAVSVCALMAVAYLFRGVLFPKRRRRKRREQRVSLTIDRKNPEA